MRLTNRQKTIAAYFQLQADAPIPEAARVLNIPQHTLRRELQRMVSSGILVRYPYIDFFKLGYVEHDLYFSVGAHRKREVAQFVRFLSAASGISWLIEVGGAYQFGLTVLARSAFEAHTILQSVSNEFPGMIVGSDFSLCYRWTLYRRRYLVDEIPSPSSLTVGQVSTQEVLEPADRKILSALSSARPRRQIELARAVAMPESTVSYRLEHLQKRKIFNGFIYSIESRLFGVTPYRLHVWLRDFASSSRQLVQKYAEAHPNIVSLAERLGGPSLTMRVEVEDGDQIFLIGQEIRELLGPEVAKVEVLPIFRERKVSPYPFLE